MQELHTLVSMKSVNASIQLNLALKFLPSHWIKLIFITSLFLAREYLRDCHVKRFWCASGVHEYLPIASYWELKSICYEQN